MTKPERNERRRAMQFRGSPAPDATDMAATVRWLRDRELIKDLYARYAYGIDSADMELVRSVFHPDCVVVGTLEEGSLDDYLEGIEHGVLMYDATMHFKGNQYVGSPIDSLVLALRYQDEVARIDDDWKITRREAAEQWHTGPFPRPFIGEPPYPRRPRDPDPATNPSSG
jgi:hypothetical protein